MARSVPPLAEIFSAGTAPRNTQAVMNYKASEHLIPIFDFDILHMQVNTPLFILALVLIVMFFMNRWLFKPVLATLDRREEHLAAMARKAEDLRAQIARLSASYEADLAKARAEVASVREQAHQQARQATEAIVGKAKEEANESLRKALEELSQDVVRVKADLMKSAQQLATAAANRVLN